MRGGTPSRGRAVLLIGLLLLQVVIAGSSQLGELEYGFDSRYTNSTLTDNGNGTWTVTYAVDMDTTLDSGNVTSSLDHLSHFEVGWNADDWRFGLLGFDLDSAGFPTNTTIESASLRIHMSASTGTLDAQAWNIHRQDWNVQQATWLARNSNSQWSSPGALGNTDSGAKQDSSRIETNSTEVQFDVTQTVKLAQYQQLTTANSRVGILLTPGFGSESEIATFHSSESSQPSQRPVVDITFRWSSTSYLSNNPSWIDISPKLGTVDADSTLDFTSTIRSERGEIINAGVSWSTSSGSVDGSGRFSPSQSGVVTITAEGGSVEGEQDVLVRPGAPLTISMAVENYSITVDDSIPIIAHGVDQYGNPVYGLTYSWSASSGTINQNGVYTPSETGSHTVAAQWGGHVAISNVSVSVGGAANIILPSNFTARAGIGTQIPVIIEDRLGNILPQSAAAGLDWVAERGSIDSAGYYVGQEVGTWQINVTSGTGATGTGWVIVSPGLANDLQIIDPNRVVSADEAIPLDLRWIDRVGNNVSVLLPLENWSAESGNFRISDGFVEWLPSQAGVWRISVHAEGVEAWIDLTVVTGAISRVWIDAEYDVMTADDESILILQAEDLRGNRWPISADWSIEESVASNSLVSDVDGVRFVGGIAGTWTVVATHSGSEGFFDAELQIEVKAGRLARILIAGDGSTISADDAFDLSPTLSDADGNIISGVQLNWSVDGVDATPQLRLSGGLWQPTATGDHLIEADAAGRTARSRIYVEQGNPHEIVVDIDTPIEGVVSSGDLFKITTFAVDKSGNQAPWPVEWNLPYNSIEVEETTELGVYNVRGLSEGIWDIGLQNGTANGNFTIQVLVGEPRSLRIGQHAGVGDQGDLFSIEVSLVDYGGNPVPMQTSKFVFDTEIGSVRHDIGPFWYLELEEPGDGQKVKIQYEQWSAITHIDVKPTGIDKLTGSQTGQVLIGGFGVATLLVVILLFILRKNAEGETHWEREFEIETTPDVVSVIESEADNFQLSRRSKRRRNFQRQQERIRSMENVTEEMATATESKSQESNATSSVLTAIDGTVQGQTGWYQTAQGEPQYWQINESGQWSRVQ
ncbi:MAG: hypothetical protein VYA86_00255 [Candidatus Thermoplasmatota archaeon]|nr:hypothetical protein [Candidatus Thermoplasmatota archaeon]